MDGWVATWKTYRRSVGRMDGWIRCRQKDCKGLIGRDWYKDRWERTEFSSGLFPTGYGKHLNQYLTVTSLFGCVQAHFKETNKYKRWACRYAYLWDATVTHIWFMITQIEYTPCNRGVDRHQNLFDGKQVLRNIFLLHFACISQKYCRLFPWEIHSALPQTRYGEKSYKYILMQSKPNKTKMRPGHNLK